MNTVIVPSRLHTISLRNKTKNLYTTFINDKQCVYSFLNLESANNCAQFLSDYKHKYNMWPTINNSDEFQKNLIPLPLETRRSLLDIRVNDLILEEEELENLQSYCIINNVGLLGITFFDFKVKDGQTDVFLNGCNLLPEDIEINEGLMNYLRVSSLNNIWLKDSMYEISESDPGLDYGLDSIDSDDEIE